jgi:hypothetical protein
MKKMWAGLMSVVIGIAGTVCATDQSPDIVSDVPPPQYEATIPQPPPQLTPQEKFAFAKIKTELLRLLEQWENKFLKTAFLDQVEKSVQQVYATLAKTDSVMTAAALSSLSQAEFAIIHDTFPKAFHALKHHIASLEEDPAQTQVLAYTLQMMKIFFPSKESVQDPFAPQSKQQDPAWILAHIQDLLAQIVAGKSDRDILTAQTQSIAELERNRPRSDAVQVEMGTSTTTSTSDPVAFRWPAFERHIHFNRWLYHGFSTRYVRGGVCGGAILMGIITMFAGIGVLAERLPRCITCPPGSDHSWDRYADYCWETGYPSQALAPSVDSGWDDACWERYTWVGALLTSAPLLFPLLVLAIEGGIIGAENALDKIFCTVLLVAAVLYGSGDYAAQQGAAGVRACRRWNQNRRHRQHVQAAQVRIERQNQVIETQLDAIPTEQNLQKELDILRELGAKFPLFHLILSKGTCVSEALATELLQPSTT